MNINDVYFMMRQCGKKYSKNLFELSWDETYRKFQEFCSLNEVES